MPRRSAARSAGSLAAASADALSSLAAGTAVYSIGAVASMVGVPSPTLRTWEERYGIVLPERTRRGHRLYSRVQIEQLRFIVSELARGASAADAHRSLAQRLATGTAPQANAQTRPRVLILVAERDRYSAELIEFLLQTEGFAVEVALDIEEARRRFELVSPDVVIVEFLLGGGAGEDLCRWLKEHGAPRILVVSGLDAADRALRAGADAFLRKPAGHLQLVSAVKDLLGLSAIVGEQR